MKKLILAMMLVGSVASAANLTNAGNVTLSWTRSSSDFLTNGVTYRVYEGTNLVGGLLVPLTNTFAGTNLAITITNLMPATWLFSAVAIQGGIESDPSNLTAFTVPVTKPGAVQLGVIWLDTSVDLINWQTNQWFRVRGYFP